MISDILELIKVRILVSALFTTVLGYVVALPTLTAFSILELSLLLIGCACIFSAAAALNHLLEIDVDRVMDRTKNRPLVQGRVSQLFVLFFSLFLISLGAFVLLHFFGLLLFMMCFLILVLYVTIYTPIKKLSTLNTIIGAFPGAMPIFCGWLVHQDSFSFLIILLFSIFYFWQLPHFYSIAWIHKQSYEAADLKMVSVNDTSGKRTFLYLAVSTAIFLFVTYLPFHYEFFSWFYLLSVLLMGLYLVLTVKDFYFERSVLVAKKILRATIIYPPVLLIVILFDIIFF